MDLLEPLDLQDDQECLDALVTQEHQDLQDQSERKEKVELWDNVGIWERLENEEPPVHLAVQDHQDQVELEELMELSETEEQMEHLDHKEVEDRWEPEDLAVFQDLMELLA